jgi:hypothetical protein
LPAFDDRVFSLGIPIDQETLIETKVRAGLDICGG